MALHWEAEAQRRAERDGRALVFLCGFWSVWGALVMLALLQGEIRGLLRSVLQACGGVL